MTNRQITRRLTITVTKAERPFTSETAYSYNGRDWTVLSTTVTASFPLILVGRVMHCDGYVIHVRAI